MRKFLFILAFVFSFCVHAETNTVQLTDDQLSQILSVSDFLRYLNVWNGVQYSSGELTSVITTQTFQNAFRLISENQLDIERFLHLLFTGNFNSPYDVQENNILAYASSLRSHNEDVRELLSSMESDLHSMAFTVGGFPSQFVRQYDITRAFHSDYTNNLERLYDAITNIDFSVSISNQIDLINGNLTSDNSPLLSKLNDIKSLLFSIMTADNTFPVRETLNNNHNELMDFLHSLSNSALFASNLCNCCVNSNFQDSVESLLEWMTNNWEHVLEEDAPVDTNGWDEVTNGTNKVWHVWHPESFGDKLLIPSVGWQEDFTTGNYTPYYATNQYDSAFNSIWQQYLALLDDYNANGKDGQKFLAGLVDLQLHILANMSTQLYMIDSKLPSKTNLWDWIEEYKSKISDEVTKAEQENNEIVSSVSYLLDYTPFGSVGGHFPKVSNALKCLKLEQGASPVVRIPIPRALRVSDSDELVVDVRESEWFSTGRTWCRWIFTFIWGWLFIRLGLVPIFYVFFFTVRVAEISAHLVFMGSVRGSSGVVSSFGASAVDMVLSLLGIDTDFKKFVWGIMRD